MSRIETQKSQHPDTDQLGTELALIFGKKLTAARSSLLLANIEVGKLTYSFDH